MAFYGWKELLGIVSCEHLACAIIEYFQIHCVLQCSSFPLALYHLQQWYVNGYKDIFLYHFRGCKSLLVSRQYSGSRQESYCCMLLNTNRESSQTYDLIFLNWLHWKHFINPYLRSLRVYEREISMDSFIMTFHILILKNRMKNTLHHKLRGYCQCVYLKTDFPWPSFFWSHNIDRPFNLWYESSLFSVFRCGTSLWHFTYWMERASTPRCQVSLFACFFEHSCTIYFIMDNGDSAHYKSHNGYKLKKKQVWLEYFWWNPL